MLDLKLRTKMNKITTTSVAVLISWIIVLALLIIRFPAVFFGVIAVLVILALLWGYYSQMVN
jgi:uncharacterized membrane protein